jgi:hypothetical protein
MTKTANRSNPRYANFYVLLVRDQDGKKVISAPSPRGLEGTRQMAQEVMRLFPEAAFTDVYTYAEGMELAKAQPIETVYREGAKEPEVAHV